MRRDFAQPKVRKKALVLTTKWREAKWRFLILLWFLVLEVENLLLSGGHFGRQEVNLQHCSALLVCLAVIYTPYFQIHIYTNTYKYMLKPI